MHEGPERQANAEQDSLRAALADALGDEFVALVDSLPELLEQQPGHLWALVGLDDPVERMQQARAYMAQIADLSHPSPGRRMHEIREMLSPAEAYAAQDTVRPAPLPPAVPAGPGRAAPARPVSAEERASAQLRLRVEGWLSEAELALRRIDANTLDRLQTEDRQVIEDLIDRVRARLLFLVSGRRYPD